MSSAPRTSNGPIGASPVSSAQRGTKDEGEISVVRFAILQDSLWWGWSREGRVGGRGPVC